MKKRYYQVGDRIRINYNPNDQVVQRVWVTVIVAVKGGDLVAVDKDGRLYTTWWDERARKCHGFRPRYFRHWRCYRAGLHYLKRGLVQALLEAQEIKIPSLARLQTFCQQKNIKLTVLEGDIEKQLVRFAQQFDDLGEFLKGRKSHLLKAAKTQLNFLLLLRDSLGRVNIGVLRCRLATIDLRFTDELRDLLGWMPHYAARLSSIYQLERQFQRNVSDLQRSLQAMISHEGFKTGQTSNRQIQGIQQAIGRQIALLKTLQPIQPFICWAGHCISDLQTAGDLIGQGNFAEAKKLLDRASEAFKLRQISFKLEDLIGQYSLDLRLKGRVSFSQYSQQIRNFIGEFGKVNDSHFIQPVVKDHIIPRLQLALAALKANFPETAKCHLIIAVAPI